MALYYQVGNQLEIGFWLSPGNRPMTLINGIPAFPTITSAIEAGETWLVNIVGTSPGGDYFVVEEVAQTDLFTEGFGPLHLPEERCWTIIRNHIVENFTKYVLQGQMDKLRKKTRFFPRRVLTAKYVDFGRPSRKLHVTTATGLRSWPTNIESYQLNVHFEGCTFAPALSSNTLGHFYHLGFDITGAAPVKHTGYESIQHLEPYINLSGQKFVAIVKD